MESSHKDILIRLRQKIIADLDVDNGIILPLTSEYILREEDVKLINAVSTKQDKAEILLDILPRRGPLAFGVFHQSLKHHYEWLSEDVDKLLSNYEVVTTGIDYYAGLSTIPPISPLTVTREEKVAQLKNALEVLQPAEYIVLHGMKGFGKSCLTASTLKDVKLVKTLFCNEVYWIKFACEHSVDEEILIQLNTLYHNVRNLEIQPESFTPLEKDSLIRFLKYYFYKPDHRNALLILDDVFDKKIINNFDFECKTLVLTTDIGVLNGRRTKIIEMNDGFTEAETLGLFAKVLEMGIKELPIEAKKIHEECKGMPLLIAMFAAQFEEFKYDMKIRSDRWKHYLQSLRDKNTKHGVIKEFLEKQKTIFDICIEQLKPDLREHYEDLAVFSEDVNITPKTLEIIWGQNVFQVEELMLNLCHKSLAAKQWNTDLKTYIYGVHDLLLCHLRKRLTQDQLTQMHKSVIEKYRKHCSNDFSKLPDDNYIYSYIGYHLEQAKLFHEFPRIYLDFDFIQAKIIHTGLSDLLLDLKKYRKYITNNNNEYEEKICDIETFLQEQSSIIAEHRRRKCLDIIQIAMNHPYDGYVAQNAKSLASSVTRQKYLYLSHDKKPGYINIPLSEEVPSDICTSSFTDDYNSILTGNTSGKVILWNCETKKQTVFNGHSKCTIKKILVSTKGDCFLTLTDTGIIKLFLLNYDDELDQNHIHVSSPRQKQNCWAGFFTNFSDQDDSLIEFSVKNEIILDMAFTYEDKYIAACTNKRTIQIWDRRGETVIPIENAKFGSITKIAFTGQSSLLHIMDESKGAFYVYSNYGNDTGSKNYRYVTCFNPQLQGKKVIFFHHVPRHDNSLIIVTEKRAIYVKWFRSSNDQLHTFKKQERAYVENDTITYVCAAITYDGDYLIVADSGGLINVWNTDVGYQPIATYKSHVTSLDTYWMKDENYHLICGSENRLLHRWKLPVQEAEALGRKSSFDAIVRRYDEVDTVVTESHQKIVIFHGENKKEVSYKEAKIVNLQFLHDVSNILFITHTHIVSMLTYNLSAIETDKDEDTKIKIIMKFSQSSEFLKILNINNDNIIVFRESDNTLRIWQNTELSYIVENTGRVISIHKLNNNYVLTITQNGVIIIWHIDLYWKSVNRIAITNSPNTHITFSCLSHKKTYLAILRESFDLILFTFFENTTVLPSHIQLQNHYTHTFSHKATYCDISQNEQYIAVGLETGQISIIDLQKQKEICQLLFHRNPIMQLTWAPVIVGAPILLSLANDELAWWNIALTGNENNIKRRSRMGITHSTSTPSFTTDKSPILQIPNSQSVDGVSNLEQNKETNTDAANNTDGVSMYWSSRIGKDPKTPQLLTAVELPQSRTPKVCISPDFTKFVTVDIYGSISTFKLFGYT